MTNPSLRDAPAMSDFSIYDDWRDAYESWRTRRAAVSAVSPLPEPAEAYPPWSAADVARLDVVLKRYYPSGHPSQESAGGAVQRNSASVDLTERSVVEAEAARKHLSTLLRCGDDAPWATILRVADIGIGALRDIRMSLAAPEPDDKDPKSAAMKEQE